MFKVNVILRVFVILSLGLCVQNSLALDLSKTTTPKVIKPSDNKVKKYKVSDQKKYSVKVKKTKKVSTKKLEKDRKQDSEYKKNESDQKKSKYDGKLNISETVVVIDNKKIETVALPQKKNEDFVSSSGIEQIVQSKKKLSQREINKFTDSNSSEEVEIKIVSAGVDSSE